MCSFPISTEGDVNSIVDAPAAVASIDSGLLFDDNKKNITDRRIRNNKTKRNRN